MLQITVIGNIGQDAKILENGLSKSVAFSVASTKTYKDKGGNKVENTNWIKCYDNYDYFEKLLPYLKKGSKVYVTGSLSLYQWKNDKTKKLEIDIRCYMEKVQLLDSKKKFTKEDEIKFEMIIEAAKKDKDFANQLKVITSQKSVETKEENNAVVDEYVDEETGEIITEQNQDDIPF